MKNKMIVVSIFFACAFGAYVLFRQECVEMSRADVLIVGTTAGYAPFVSINPQGEYEGFDIDVSRALAQQMDRSLEIKDCGSMTSLFMALEQGSIDVIIWALSITEDRLKNVAMIHYQGDETYSYPLIFWKEIPAHVHSINDMRDKTVCVEPTSAQDHVLSRYNFINKMPVDKVDDALLNIQYGKADAALVEPAIAKKFKNKYPEIQIMNVPLDVQDQVHGMGITIKKNNHTLIEDVQKAVALLQSTDVIKKLEKKWDIPS